MNAIGMTRIVSFVAILSAVITAGVWLPKFDAILVALEAMK